MYQLRNNLISKQRDVVAVT